jgi:hypothetical protein
MRENTGWRFTTDGGGRGFWTIYEDAEGKVYLPSEIERPRTIVSIGDARVGTPSGPRLQDLERRGLIADRLRQRFGNSVALE